MHSELVPTNHCHWSQMYACMDFKIPKSKNEIEEVYKYKTQI